MRMCGMCGVAPDEAPLKKKFRSDVHYTTTTNRVVSSVRGEPGCRWTQRATLPRRKGAGRGLDSPRGVSAR